MKIESGESLFNRQEIRKKRKMTDYKFIYLIFFGLLFSLFICINIRHCLRAKRCYVLNCFNKRANDWLRISLTIVLLAVGAIVFMSSYS